MACKVEICRVTNFGNKRVISLKFIFTIIKKGTKIRIIVNQNNPRNDSVPGMLNVGIFNVGFQTQAAVAHSALRAGGFSIVWL